MAIVKLNKPARAAAVAPAELRDVASLEELQAVMAREKISSSPCDVSGIAGALGIKVVYEAMDDEVSGFLEQRAGGWVAGINSYHHPVRQRFTLAHEIAHFVLHRGDQSSFSDRSFARRRDDRQPMERDADSFAAALLMPTGDVRAAVDKGLRNLNDLARHFDVSTLAMRFRLEKLGYRMG
ncbi:MAG: ImmA/IrrE family metallo-endopeptidase [Pseudomonas sp.]|uniref:ImmA/IrrE family metallo-endopeptidase n=1 Tax=Stenotrophomonas sp. TaxID=69392 RepID=UPI003D6D4CCA